MSKVVNQMSRGKSQDHRNSAERWRDKQAEKLYAPRSLREIRRAVERGKEITAEEDAILSKACEPIDCGVTDSGVHVTIMESGSFSVSWPDERRQRRQDEKVAKAKRAREKHDAKRFMDNLKDL